MTAIKGRVVTRMRRTAATVVMSWRLLGLTFWIVVSTFGAIGLGAISLAGGIDEIRSTAKWLKARHQP